MQQTEVAMERRKEVVENTPAVEGQLPQFTQLMEEQEP